MEPLVPQPHAGHAGGAGSGGEGACPLCPRAALLRESRGCPSALGCQRASSRPLGASCVRRSLPPTRLSTFCPRRPKEGSGFLS